MIPSPPFTSIPIGPFEIHLYGIIIALALTLCYYTLSKLAKNKNISQEEIDHYFFLSIPFAILGARAYHVGTNWDYYMQHLNLIPAIWNGGLGIMGGVITVIITLYILTKRKHRTFFELTDLFAIILPLGQAIGRWGNYFNQELYGKPTQLPWGVYIDPQHRLQGYENDQTFHPTFLYESLLNLCNFIFLLFICKKRPHLPPGIITAVYFINYGIIRFLVELIKIDPDVTAQIGPLRVPQYFSLLLIITGTVLLITIQKRASQSPQSSEK